MKNIKKIVAVMFTLALVLGIFAIPAMEVKADAEATVTKAVHLSVGDAENNSIKIKFAEKGEHVKNLKTSSKNLKAKVTYLCSSPNSSNIGLYAAKKGTYTVSFDIVDKEEKKISSHSVKVYADTEQAVKSVKFAGKQIQDYKTGDKTKGKLSVTMNKGYTLNKIVVETCDQNGEWKSATVKNNSTIELGKYPRLDISGEGVKYEDEYGIFDLSTSLGASTEIIIYYTDKYTKNEEYVTYVMRRLAL